MRTSADPREVCSKEAIRINAHSLIMAHQYPLGDPSPSQPYIITTQRVKNARQILGITVIDHVIIGKEGRYFSFFDSELKAHGITTATALSAEAILELGKRYDEEAYFIHGTLHNPGDVYTTFKDEMAGFPDTTYNVIAVNTKNMVTVTKLFPSMPTVTQIMRWAVSNSAAALFVCRSSTGTPFITYEEERFMVELSDAGDVVGIDLLDFMIMGACNYASGRVDNIL